MASRDTAISPTRIRRHLNAPRARVYRALLDPREVARWKVPNGMTCTVHAFDPREGGAIRISLTYNEPTGAGKTTAHTDTYTGCFAKLVPNEQVVEVDEFETDDPALRGAMTSTITLADTSDGGTDLVAVHEGLPPGVSPADNETGWRMALDKLATLVESDGDGSYLSATSRSGVIRFAQARHAIPGPAGEHAALVLARGTLDVKLSMPRAAPAQTPHEQDEIYVIVRGRGALVHGDGRRDAFEAGDLLFVAAGVEHQYEVLSDDLALWRIFYGPRGGEVPE